MKKVNLSISVASLVMVGLVGCNSNLTTSKPVAQKSAAVKTQVAAGAATANAAAAPTLDMTTALPGTWICNNTLSEALPTPLQCADGETVIISGDLQTMDMHILNYPIATTTQSGLANSNCAIDVTYKLAASNYTSGNAMTGTLTSTEISPITGAQNDADCDTEISNMNKNPTVTEAATFTINTQKSGGNALTVSLTNSKGAVQTKVYVEATPVITQDDDSAPAVVTNLNMGTSTLPTLSAPTAPVVTEAPAAATK